MDIIASCHITNGESIFFSLYFKKIQAFFSKIVEGRLSFDKQVSTLLL